MLDHQEAMSESEIQVKKESFHTGEGFSSKCKKNRKFFIVLN